MKWEFTTDAPIYAQLIEQIKVAIVTDEYPPGKRLPSVRDLAADAGVNPNTMQRAMSELERQGFVCSQRTSGRLVTQDQTLIADAKNELAKTHIQTFTSAMKRLGFEKEDMIALLKQEDL